MDRPLIYTQEQLRSYDIGSGWRDSLKSNAQQTQDILGGTTWAGGSTTTVATGLAGTQTTVASLTINLGIGAIYQSAVLDATAAGSLPSDGGTYYQQGINWSPQQLTLTTAALTSGHSQWVLVQAALGSVDIVRVGDPSGGVLPFYNSANPAVPLQGQGGSGGVLNTERTTTLSFSAVYGTPAATGSQVPPSASAGNVGLYLILLTFGQTAITTGNIITAGPSVGTGVPSNYPYAPFLAGLLNQHHKGVPGQAPQIDLTSEVKNVLPTANYQTSGTFTGTLTGFTTTVNVSCSYITIGTVVVLNIQPNNGTSNSTAFGMNGVPSAIVPQGSTGRYVSMGYTGEDGSSVAVTDIYFPGSGGQPAFIKNGGTNNWTASGTKGIGYPIVVTYML